ncbi:hypothetical protein F444_20860 [Phytophthora nicotianae P1976]|uniref:Myb/SANT-like domain-containing protein n=2 Tax=Phytophthora nicotianae TaxID=4792 RepID=A0A080Z353_PHYNI|nr:hypothetical protein F444_20860 [Phytophthora nicotianae P1976]
MSSSGPRASWDTAKDAFLIDAMTDQARAGKRSDSGFKKEAWAALKGKYTAVSEMLSASGFGWDAERNVVLVHDDVWNDYVVGHPKCVDFRKTPLPYYDELKELFEGTFATGEHAIASDEPRPTDFITGHNAPPAEASAVLEGNATDAPATTPSTASPSAGATQQQEAQLNAKKRNRESGGAMIAGAIKEIAGEMHNRNVRLKVLPPSQKAVKILQRAYGDRFAAVKMAAAFDIMMDERKARLFVVMEEGEVRDIWLENQLQQSI